MNSKLFLLVFSVCFVFLQTSNAKNEYGFHTPLTLIPHLASSPSFSQLKQKMLNVSEKEIWKEINQAVDSLKLVRRNHSEILSMIERDFENGQLRSSNIEGIEECALHVNQMIEDRREELYAMRMWDSWGTPEGGVLEGNVRWPGHYYECKIAKNDVFSGKWCLSYYGLIFQEIQQGLPFDMTLGVCFPSTCSNEAIEYIYQTYFIESQFPPFLQLECPPDPSWMTVDTICAVVLGVLFLCLIAGTVYDLLVRYEVLSQKKLSASLSNKLLMSFSVISNTEQIIDMKTKKGNIQTLDGIRVITTSWVIMGHLTQMWFFTMDNPVFARRQILKDPGFMAIINPFYSVDTFFFISGLLVTYLGLKHLDKTKGFLNVPFMYLQRYLRLTPIYAFAILFHMSLYKFLGDGPGWISFTKLNYDTCKDNWWTNLLYINDFYPYQNECFKVAWYLANDMQMFLLSPVFILLFYHFRTVGIFSTFGVILFSTLYNGLVTYYHDIQPFVNVVLLPLNYLYRWFIIGSIVNGSNEQSYEYTWLTDIYFMPWARIHVYMIGMLTGYYFYVSKGKIKIPKVFVIVGWIMAAGAALAIIYGPYVYVKDMKAMPNDLSAFYNAVGRPVFIAAVAWVVIACCAGYGGPVTKLLDWNVFKPLSRLTYSTYIVHIYIVYYYGYTQETNIHFLIINLVYVQLSTVALSFGCGFIFSVFVEWPFAGVCKALFYPTPRKISTKTELPVVNNQNSTSEWSSYADHINDGDHSSLNKAEKKSSFMNDSYVNEQSLGSENTKL